MGFWSSGDNCTYFCNCGSSIVCTETRTSSKTFPYHPKKSAIGQRIPFLHHTPFIVFTNRVKICKHNLQTKATMCCSQYATNEVIFVQHRWLSKFPFHLPHSHILFLKQVTHSVEADLLCILIASNVSCVTGQFSERICLVTTRRVLRTSKIPCCVYINIQICTSKLVKSGLKWQLWHLRSGNVN